MASGNIDRDFVAPMTKSGLLPRWLHSLFYLSCAVMPRCNLPAWRVLGDAPVTHWDRIGGGAAIMDLSASANQVGGLQLYGHSHYSILLNFGFNFDCERTVFIANLETQCGGQGSYQDLW